MRSVLIMFALPTFDADIAFDAKDKIENYLWNLQTTNKDVAAKKKFFSFDVNFLSVFEQSGSLNILETRHQGQLHGRC